MVFVVRRAGNGRGLPSQTSSGLLLVTCADGRVTQSLCGEDSAVKEHAHTQPMRNPGAVAGHQRAVEAVVVTQAALGTREDLVTGRSAGAGLGTDQGSDPGGGGWSQVLFALIPW